MGTVVTGHIFGADIMLLKPLTSLPITTNSKYRQTCHNFFRTYAIPEGKRFLEWQEFRKQVAYECFLQIHNELWSFQDLTQVFQLNAKMSIDTGKFKVYSGQGEIVKFSLSEKL